MVVIVAKTIAMPKATINAVKINRGPIAFGARRISAAS
jgi:hypothetical protein